MIFVTLIAMTFHITVPIFGLVCFSSMPALHGFLHMTSKHFCL